MPFSAVESPAQIAKEKRPASGDKSQTIQLAGVYKAATNNSKSSHSGSGPLTYILLESLLQHQAVSPWHSIDYVSIAS